MTTARIIYPTDSGIAVIIPTGLLSIEEVARKDVPHGVSFRIVDQSDLPADREFRGAWEADFSSPDGHGIGYHRWFIEQADARIEEIEARVAPVAPQPITAASIDEVEWAEGVTEEQRPALYAEYVARVAQLNAMREGAYEEACTAFYARQSADLALQQDTIVQMKSEVFETEGVQL